MDGTRMTRRVLVAVAAAGLVAGCATPYAPSGFSGGFKEEKIAPDSYMVGFYGNGYTSEDMVVKYWLHRCAELTIKEGYEYFGLKGLKVSSVPNGDIVAVLGPASGFVPTRSAGGPVYIYVPSYGGSGARKYSKFGTIVMYHSRLGAMTPEQTFALNAKMVVEMLKPFIASQGKEAGPSRQEVIRKAMEINPEGLKGMDV